MSTLTFNKNSYPVDHAVKGLDYVHGYDATGNVVVSIEGIDDFSIIEYDGEYLTPEACATEPCNEVLHVNGILIRRDGTPVYPEVLSASPDTLHDVLRIADAGSIIQLSAGTYPRLNLIGKKAYPERLTILGDNGVTMAGISITSGVLDTEVDEEWRFDGTNDSENHECSNGDTSNAILPRGLTIKNLLLSDSISLRNGSIDDLTIEGCSFGEGAFVNIDPNNMKDCYGNDWKNGATGGKEYFSIRPPYAQLHPKNLVVKECTFVNASGNKQSSSGDSAIRVVGVDGIVIYKNTIKGAGYNGVNIVGTYQSSVGIDIRSSGKIAITNNQIYNTGSRSIRIAYTKDADFTVCANTMSTANQKASEQGNTDYIKASGCVDTTFEWGTNGYDTRKPNLYNGTAITVGSGISASATNGVTTQTLGIADYVIAEGKSGGWYYKKWSNGFAECWGYLDNKYDPGYSGIISVPIMLPFDMLPANSGENTADINWTANFTPTHCNLQHIGMEVYSSKQLFIKFNYVHGVDTDTQKSGKLYITGRWK